MGNTLFYSKDFIKNFCSLKWLQGQLIVLFAVESILIYGGLSRVFQLYRELSSSLLVLSFGVGALQDHLACPKPHSPSLVLIIVGNQALNPQLQVCHLTDIQPVSASYYTILAFLQYLQLELLGNIKMTNLLFFHFTVYQSREEEF